MTKPRQPNYGKIFADDPCKKDEALAVWKEVVAELSDKGLVTETRLKIADRYARACAEYSVLYPIASGEGPVKVGPNGGDVFNFNWSACEKLNDRLAKFEDQLRLDLRHSDVSERPAASTPSRPSPLRHTTHTP